MALGSEARIVLDAIPRYVLPATVSFAAEAQFTPKSVETANEREKLMSRVKLKLDAKLLETEVRGVPMLQRLCDAIYAADGAKPALADDAGRLHVVGRGADGGGCSRDRTGLCRANSLLAGKSAGNFRSLQGKWL